MSLSDLKAMPGHLVRRLQQISTAIFAEELAEYDLTSVQFAALMAIGEGTVDATRLAEMIAFDRATIGGVIERLERKGLVRRTVSPSDKRIKLLSLTPIGRVVIKTAYPRVSAVQQRLLATLSEEEAATLLSLLSKVVAANDERMGMFE